MKTVYVSISTAVVKFTLDDELYENIVRDGLGDIDNTLEAISDLLSVLSLYTLASVDFANSGNPASQDARNRIHDKAVGLAVAALWRFNQTVTTSHDALLQVDYDRSKRGAIKGFAYNQFNNSVEPYMVISFAGTSEDSDFLPTVYVKIGTTATSPVIGVNLKKGRVTTTTSTEIENIVDTEDAIEKYVVGLGQYVSAFYYHYIAKVPDAKLTMDRISTDVVLTGALLLSRFTKNRNPDGVPLLMVVPKDLKKALIVKFAIKVLPKPPIPPELQASFTIGDPESRVLH